MTASAMYGRPPWTHGPTPPLEVFVAAWREDPDVLHRLKQGHLVNLLEQAMPALLQAARILEQDERRKAVKRDNQARFRAARRSRLNGRPS